MCYSKEVSLAVAGAVACGSGYTWWTYIRGGAEKRAANDGNLHRFYVFALLALVFLGGHQLFEFLAISTGSQLIYKIGLAISLTITFWLIKSLEALSGFKMGSWVFAVAIGLTAIQMLLKDMTFANEHFWVSGYSHFVWGAVWVALFLYWNVCLIYLSLKSKSKKNGQLILLYSMLALNVSFLMSLFYGYAAVVFQKGCGTCGSDVLSSFYALQDFPSIWCVFAVVHTALIPILFRIMRENYDPKAGFNFKRLPILRLILFAIIAFLVLYCLNLEVIFGVAWKMVTR